MNLKQQGKERDGTTVTKECAKIVTHTAKDEICQYTYLQYTSAHFVVFTCITNNTYINPFNIM